ncbi:sensor histidine kinase [Micromonospora auratinigra]|uniref:histidine kinase n=1 Tax=Micromonospora auratinigra TaxID=261654 RepID=A0A1A8ZVS9_9ACTN|nr:sensor domain-containing protein [Micromonospora auratinigra]SBT48219.1 Signal transduction histidine kinase [Micromonospora auratinigra]
MTAAPVTTEPPHTSSVAALTRQLGRDSGYVLLGLPLGLVGFVLAVVGTALGLGLLVTALGLPVLAGTLYTARGLADLERLRLPPVLREPRLPRPAYRRPEPGASLLRRILVPLRDPQCWLDLLHAVLRPLLALPTFAVLLVWWAVALVGTFTVAYDWAIPRGPDDQDLSELLGMGSGTAPRVILNTAIGLFFLLTLPLVARACARIQAGPARALLVGMAEMRHRISTLEDQKRAAASAEATALRRLERDIHDGPQQRLVRLAMDLGRARQQLAADPEAAGRTLDEAVTQTRETLAELRALSRGIAPPILVDRGLPSALAALAARALVPVELTVDDDLGTPGGRLDPAVENTSYFVVAEALTNVAKHSAATGCRVEVTRRAGRLEISVADDGTGGAHLAKGHGLAGIADRVRATGGTLEVASPTGGPTLVRAELPG